MSGEQDLRELLNMEKKKNEDLHLKLQGHSTRENILEEQLIQLRKKLQNVKSANSTPSPPEQRHFQALTDLHINQSSTAGNINARTSNNSGSSSSSFIVIGKQSVSQSPGFKAVENANPVPETISVNQEENSHGGFETTERRPVQSCITNDSTLKTQLFHPPGSENTDSLSDAEKTSMSKVIAEISGATVPQTSPVHSYSWPQNPEAWHATGARPKNTFPTANQEMTPTERSHTPEVPLSVNETGVLIDLNTQMLVKIPGDEGTYRINNPPPLNFGQDISMTGISSIFSPESVKSPGVAPPFLRSRNQDTEISQLNDLNAGTTSIFKRPSSLWQQLQPLKKAGDKQDDSVLYIQPSQNELTDKEDIDFPSLSTQASEPKTVVAMLSKDDVELASQLKNLVSHLKLKILNAEEVEKINKCAEEAVKLEEKLKNYEAIIQRYQVYSSSLQENAAELERLRRENEQLRQLLQSPYQPFGAPMADLEPGWVSVSVNEREQKAKEDKMLQNKIKELSIENNQLYLVNKNWQDFHKSSQEEHAKQWEEKEEHIQALMRKKELVEKEKDSIIKELKEELNKLKMGHHELEQKDTVRQSHFIKEQKIHRKLKSELENSHRARKDAESRANTLTDKVTELETENVVLKQQLTMCMDDFHKEKGDKKILEDQLTKLRNEKTELKRSLDGKLKNANLMLKKREEELLSKDKAISDLHKLVEDLNSKVRIAERRMVIPPSIQDVSLYPSDMFYPSASPAYNPNQLKLLQQQKEITENSGGVQQSLLDPSGAGNIKGAASGGFPDYIPPSLPTPAKYPEHLPESWSCNICTFKNTSASLNCVMCNAARLTDASMAYSFESSQMGLTSRDDYRGKDVPDNKGEIDVD